MGKNIMVLKKKHLKKHIKNYKVYYNYMLGYIYEMYNSYLSKKSQF